MTVSTKRLQCAALLVTSFCSVGTVAYGDTCSAVSPMNRNENITAVRIVVRSVEQVAISAEINARVIQVPRREGDVFERGDTLIAFDCARLAAERDVAVATYKAATAAHDVHRALGRYKAASTLDIDKSRFEMERAEAEVRVIDARLSTCTIKAPFRGKVVEKVIQLNEIAQPNQPLIRVLDEDRLDLVMMVPSAVVALVSPGAVFPVCIDETGDVHDAEVVQSTGLIDPVSQSVRVLGAFTKRPVGVLPGMSGTGSLRLRRSKP